MPPLSFEYRGIPDVRGFFIAIDAHRRTISHLIPTRANGQPAWGEYASDPVTGSLHCVGLLVAGCAAGGVSELTQFETAIAPYFALPRVLA